MIRNDLSVALVRNSIFDKKTCTLVNARRWVSDDIDEQAHQLTDITLNGIRSESCIGSELINNNDNEIKSLVRKLNTLV